MLPKARVPCSVRWSPTVFVLCLVLAGCGGCTVQPENTAPPPSDTTETSVSSSAYPAGTSGPTRDNPPIPSRSTATPSQKTGFLTERTAGIGSRMRSVFSSPAQKNDGDMTHTVRSKSKVTAASALQNAQELRAQASDNMRRKEPGKAYAKILEAWTLVKDHPEDTACSALRDQLSHELESLASKANARYRSLESDEVLIEQ